jgi:5-(carboxyamino)imidazole ribonucleotide mutase
MQDAMKTLESAKVSFAVVIASAHRSLKFLQDTIKKMESNGVKVFIAGAGSAAALPGVIAAETILPVVGVPMDSSSLKGVDALYSIVQMPPGIPVAAVAVGKNGAKNAALLAIQILAVSNDKLAVWVREYRKKMNDEIIQKSKNLEEKGYKKYIEEMGK